MQVHSRAVALQDGLCPTPRVCSALLSLSGSEGGPPEALKVLPPGALTVHSLWRAGEHVGGEFPSLKYLLFTLEAFVSLLVLYLPAEVRAILPGPV